MKRFLNNNPHRIRCCVYIVPYMSLQLKYIGSQSFGSFTEISFSIYRNSFLKPQIDHLKEYYELYKTLL